MNTERNGYATGEDIPPAAGIGPAGLSIVVQGPVYNTGGRPGASVTGRALASIRKNFPGAELILSTWEGSDVAGLDYDVLVTSRDPGSAVSNESHGRFHNVNRQLVSTLAGLKAASRKYAIKTRTETVFTHNKCVEYLLRYPLRSVDCRLTRQRVLVASVTSVNPRKRFQLPYHPCDWFYCGLKEDLVDIFDIPPFPEPEFTHWFKTRAYPENHPNFSNTARYAAESYIWYSFCRKRLDISFDHLCDISGNNLEISEKTFANNLVVLKPEQLGIVSLKNKYEKSVFYDMYTFTEWKRLYNKYCHGGLPAGFDRDMLLYALPHYFEAVRARVGFRARTGKLRAAASGCWRALRKLSGL